MLYFNKGKMDLKMTTKDELSPLADVITANPNRVMEHLMKERNVNVRKRGDEYVVQIPNLHSNQISCSISAPPTIKMYRK